MKTIIYSQKNKSELEQLFQRRTNYSAALLTQVKNIMRAVESKGDDALYEFAEKYDGVRLEALRVSAKEIRRAVKGTPASLRRAMEDAAVSIKKFHASTLLKENVVETKAGVSAWREWRPIENIGLYIPGGKANYPSTALMLGIPAMLARCKKIVVCTPPNKQGEVARTTLAALSMLGITTIYKAGGAQAIAALAYGTESIPKMDKIFGPGNAYVTAAKMLAYPGVDIDMPAGPTEIFIIADETADPRFVAADFLSQLEHSEDAQAVLATPNSTLAERVAKKIASQTPLLAKKTIIQESLKRSFIIVTSSINEAIDISNRYAPEHLEIMTKNPEALLKKITNAGSVFLGPYAPVSAGDYATGTNHTLPTSGFARMFSPVSVESFGKKIQVQKLTKKGLASLQTTIGEIATAEELTAHKKAVDIRFE